VPLTAICLASSVIVATASSWLGCGDLDRDNVDGFGEGAGKVG
jgi:hypothetical protein